MNLYIDFTTPEKANIFSSLIKYFQKTKYSHIRLRWTNSTGREVIYEASGTEIKFLGTIAQKQRSNKILKTYKIELNRDEYRSLIDVCMELAGIKYGKNQVVGILLVNLFNLKTNPFSDGRKSQVCSELVARILEKVKNYHIAYDLDIAGPREIDLTLEELSSDFEEVELIHG